MIFLKGYKQEFEKQEGATLILVAVAMLALLGFAALAVDIGYLMASKNELQNAADAAALAGAGELGDQYLNEESPNASDIRVVVREIAAQNRAAGVSLSNVLDSDIEVKCWNQDNNPKFFECPLNKNPNAVRVLVRRDSNANSPISTFFGNVFGISSFQAVADATAALSGLSKIDQGKMIPVGISRYWFDYDWPGDFCDQSIKFYPTGAIEGCAGWNTFDRSPASASYLRDTILDGMLDGYYESPEAEVGDEFEFIGGNVANALCHPSKSDLQELYDANKNSTGDWKTSVIVYDMDDCSNPTGSLEILGFATAIIHGVSCASTQEINATVICEEVEDDRGGGTYYGTYGRIPGLVE
jgi:hypothetical protein